MAFRIPPKIPARVSPPPPPPPPLQLPYFFEGLMVDLWTVNIRPTKIWTVFLVSVQEHRESFKRTSSYHSLHNYIKICSISLGELLALPFEWQPCRIIGQFWAGIAPFVEHLSVIDTIIWVFSVWRSMLVKCSYMYLFPKTDKISKLAQTPKPFSWQNSG